VFASADNLTWRGEASAGVLLFLEDQDDQQDDDDDEQGAQSDVHAGGLPLLLRRYSDRLT
jgi:hypothetical protein